MGGVPEIVEHVKETGLGKLILLGQVGSKSYGTDTPESDNDYMGIVVPPLEYYIGLDHHEEGSQSKQWAESGHLKFDRKVIDNSEFNIFELRKFLRLSLNFNPNIIPLLYLRKEDYAVRTSLGGLLITMRHAFVSKKAYATLIGYAKSQRKAVVDGDTGKLGMKRKDLVARYGYDVKFASHTIRILRMGIEFFQSNGEILNVYRETDREELIDIRNGKYSLEKWVHMVDHELDRAREMEKKNTLPDQPKYNHVNHLSSYIIKGGSG